MNRKDFEIDALCDYSVKMIEDEIVHAYKNTYHYDFGDEVLLNLRRDIINKELLAHQADLLPEIIASMMPCVRLFMTCTIELIVFGKI